MLHQDDGQAEIGDAADETAQRILVGAHQPGRGLVEQQHLWAHGERAGDLDQPAVDMRQVAGQCRERAVIAREREQRLGGGGWIRARGQAFRMRGEGRKLC